MGAWLPHPPPLLGLARLARKGHVAAPQASSIGTGYSLERKEAPLAGVQCLALCLKVEALPGLAGQYHADFPLLGPTQELQEN